MDAILTPLSLAGKVGWRAAHLATAGTGDVLAGWLGGRWAQHASGRELEVGFIAARHAVAEHGAGAEPPPSGALRAGDLIERLRAL